MPITLKYGNPGPIINAGYAAGVGNKAKEQKQDLLKVWQQNNAQAFEAQQAQQDRMLRVGLQQQGLQFQAQQGGLDRDAARMRQLNAELNDNNQAAMQRDFAAEQADKAIAARAKADDLDRGHRMFMGLPDIPESVTGDKRKALLNAREAIRAAETDPTVDRSNPEVIAAKNKAYQDYMDGVASAPTGNDAFAANIVQDPETKVRFYKDPSGRPIPLPDPAAEQAALQQQQKFKMQEQQGKAEQKRRDDLAKLTQDKMNEKDPLDTTKNRYASKEEAAKAAKEEHDFLQGIGQGGVNQSKWGDILPPGGDAQPVATQPAAQPAAAQPQAPAEVASAPAPAFPLRKGSIRPPGSQAPDEEDIFSSEPSAREQAAAGEWNKSMPAAPAPGSQDQILQDLQTKHEVGQLKADLPQPTPEQMAAPVVPKSKADFANLEHGAVIGPIAGPDGTPNMYQWNAKAGKMVMIRQPDRGPAKREWTQPPAEFGFPMM